MSELFTDFDVSWHAAPIQGVLLNSISQSAADESHEQIPKLNETSIIDRL